MRSLALLLLAAFALPACAEAPPPAPAAAPPPRAFSREVSPTDAEMLTIGRAEEEIDHLFPATDGRRPKKNVPAPADETKPDGLKDAEKPALGASGDPCAVACKALGSMATAADRLCRLAGENDGRCDDARARVRGATGRVKAACPSCVVVASPTAPPNAAPPAQAPAGPAPGMPGSASPTN